MSYSKKNNMKPIRVLVMSVGERKNNHTCRYLERIGARDYMTVCLPMQYEQFAASYLQNGIDVYLYDEKAYINENFEYFGFKPRNCGGIGRQGIAEAVEKYGDEYLCFQMDDDYTAFRTRSVEARKWITITKWENLANMIYAFAEFRDMLKMDMVAKTGATMPKDNMIANKKCFNNFLMQKGERLNFDGFAALCSDDQRYNIYHNLLDCTPMLSSSLFDVMFYKNQGDRRDGNAVLYNSDCSWKKSFALKMIAPWAIEQHVAKEENRVLFREFIEASKLYPRISLEENGKLVVYV